jgi:hypothetical protein
MSDEQWIVRLAEEKRLLKNYRGRRLQACRAVDTLCDVIDNLGTEDGSVLPDPDHGFQQPPSAAMRLELKNQAAVLLRMILANNDRGCGPHELQRF